MFKLSFIDWLRTFNCSIFELFGSDFRIFNRYQREYFLHHGSITHFSSLSFFFIIVIAMRARFFLTAVLLELQCLLSPGSIIGAQSNLGFLRRTTVMKLLVHPQLQGYIPIPIPRIIGTATGCISHGHLQMDRPSLFLSPSISSTTLLFIIYSRLQLFYTFTRRTSPDSMYRL